VSRGDLTVSIGCWVLPRNASLFPTETQKWVDGHDLAAPDTPSPPLSGRLAFSRADPSLPTSSSSMHVHIQKKNAAITALHFLSSSTATYLQGSHEKNTQWLLRKARFSERDVRFAHAPRPVRQHRQRAGVSSSSSSSSNIPPSPLVPEGW
jgi:hypothetical protein